MSKTANDEIEKLIEQQVGIKPGANDLTPMDYLECKTIAQKYADQRVSEALNSQWVSVKERLPEDRELVVVFMLYGTNDFSRWTGYRLNGEWMDCNGQLKLKSVTHWTNLPSPPLNH